MPDNSIAVSIRDVSFSYATPRRQPLISKVPYIRRLRMVKHTVLHGINLTIRQGNITALVGRNGSGKTSLIKLISGMRYPEGGSIQVFGTTPEKARQKIGLCLGGLLVYHRLTARENLQYFGRLYGVENLEHRIDTLADILEYRPALDDMVETFSFGMKAKLALSRALIHSPELLILDEPTLGIDIQIASQIRSFIRELKCSVILTSHYMDEIDDLAQDICIIDEGKVLAAGAKQEITKRFGMNKMSEVFKALIDKDSSLRQAS